MERLGLGYDALAAVNPRLIYAGMFGFSQRGRYAASAAFDDLIQAACALPQAMALSSGDIPRYLPITIADRSVGLYAFGVISAALYGRERNGRGQRVDIPMFETMVPQVLGDHLYGQTFVPPQGDFGYPRLLSPERRPYQTQLDGHVCCLIYTDAQWKAFLRAIGQPERCLDGPALCHIRQRTQPHRRVVHPGVRRARAAHHHRVAGAAGGHRHPGLSDAHLRQSAARRAPG
jgi:crotonobetainyl-CoA:carnitine CoA-transferase CaiB-like acyl-CoA transferase